MNSKKLALLAIFGLLILGIGAFGFYTKKMNSEGFRGIGFTVSGVEKEDVNGWVGVFKAVLAEDKILQEIVTKSDYSAKLQVSEADALDHLRKAILVNHNETRDTIQIGLRGKRKHNDRLDGIAKEIFNIAGPYVATQKPAFNTHYLKISQPGQ